jgi:homoserine O-succinyltransferase
MSGDCGSVDNAISLRARQPNPLACNGYDSQLVIGIVDNTPRTALRTTGHQFRDLLADASQGSSLRVLLYCLPELQIAESRGASEELWTSRLDGLIVTGSEPLAPSLIGEPCWPLLARLVDWAEDNTISAVWSCLAAHAAVYRLDGIERRAFSKKLFGIFNCTNLYQHAVLDECPPQWQAPHSRYNDLPGDALIARGYRFLTQSPAAGVDSFMKQGKSLHFFLQGHPEYDLAALLREYRRDVKRFLTAESDRYPEIPHGYFAAETAAALEEFRRNALTHRNLSVFEQFPQHATTLSSNAPWRDAAIRMFHNWLTYLADQKSARTGATHHGSVPAKGVSAVSTPVTIDGA